VLAADLPLTPAPAPGAAAPLAQAPSNAFELGGFTIWGVDGDTVTAADFAYDAAAKTLTVNTDRHFAIQNTDQTKVTSGDGTGRIANPTDVGLVIPSGRNATLSMEGLSIESTQPIDIKPGAALTVILGDGTKNELAATDGMKAALHCPTGASLTIDDTVANRTAEGSPIIPEDGAIPADCILANGQRVSKGDPLSKLDSSNPGELYAWTVSGSNAAAIGSDYNGAGWSIAHACEGEPGGNMTFEGGRIIATSGYNADTSWTNGGAGIGAGTDGNGTGPNEWITINGGRITATGGGHGAGIGAGLYAASGNIRINGGFVEAFGGVHSSGFGGACNPQDSSAFKIILTGGTLLPTGGNAAFSSDAGAPNIKVIVTGGSLGNQSGAEGFRFIGTATNGKGDSITMVEVDFTSDVGESPYPIVKWQLLVDGVPYDYGAPAEFDKGHLYLWLPEEVKKNSEVTVKFTYLNTDKLDESGNPTPVTPLPLFRPADSQRPPGAPDDGKLRRYVDFELPGSYTDQLTKYYDGKPFPSLPLPFEAPDGRNLTDSNAITYKYQRLDANGDPIGPELESHDPSGASQMPSDVGSMKFTAISTQYSDDTEGHFSESYWGHRATGTCEILPIGSHIKIESATWENSETSEQENESSMELTLTCTVKRAETDPSGAPTKATCAAPAGYIQLFVDGKKAGDPIEILFADKTLPDGTVLPANATASGDTTTFAFTAAPSAMDHLVPVATPNGRHVISVQYLPPNDDDAAPANYLASANPLEDPDAAPKVEVAISPIDPNPTVTPEPDPDCADPDAPEPEVSTGPGQPADPGADPAKPGDKAFRGTIVTTWGEPSEANPHPGRVLLKVTTPSSGPISVTDAKGNVFEADFLRGEDGQPVRGEDGSYTLVLDPTAVGKGQLTFRQEPNGAYTGSTWIYDVIVRPDATVAPAPALAKRAENLTHPNGPTQPGDRIRYTIEASN
ncbi:hypothetical protein NSA09_12540, partial [Adlercreutzia mucosicola]|uniref:hypothetical protein n=1 Tax=Adlercreutzia mucosicola TaxID=580026 RepID=UPI00214CFB7F